ncbi:hypothetical protein [Hoylesella enoeca]|uniref:Fimbrillin family protein n=1 Tax=Hoylesella enoeca TaxID=76123 RepID=A0A0S2KK40_9BACT|nr:hypothetical protein [Hoylesella enoeca]ALO48657.1 hypothetical protein AS203_05845 [Hoylesella enoeca]
MKKYIFLSAALLLFTTSCSNDENNEQKEPTQAVQFSFTNEEFGEDETLTRASETAKPQIVDLGDCEAEITVESEPTAKKTRGALSPANGHYTIRAYQSGTLKGEMKGTFGSSMWAPTFTPDASSKDKLRLPYGTYDFVAFNDDVTVSGTNLTTTRDKAETARMGFATVTITGPTPVYVQFTMKHVGARLRMEFICKKDIPNTTTVLEATAANVVPASIAYNPTTKAYTTTNGAMTPATSNLPSTEVNPPLSLWGQDYAFKTTSDYFYFLPSTEVSNLKFSFSGAKIFWEPITAAQKLNFALSMQVNKSYLVKIKLKPLYTYLMSDGTTGHFKDTTFGGGSKTPIAVVLDKNNRIAIALHDAGTATSWCPYPVWSIQANTNTVTTAQDALTTHPTSGYDETWDASYSTSAVTGNKVKGLNPNFTAFKSAADYNPGVAYTGSPALKWFLPSYSDWKMPFSLGFANIPAVPQVFQHYDWYGNLFASTFTQVGGTALIPYKGYWTSSEIKDQWAGTVFLSFERSVMWEFNYKSAMGNYRVRPFVKY